MPAFEDRLKPEEIWRVMAFVHAETDAQEAQGLTSRVGQWRPIVAPDFPFEVAGEQETLAGQRGPRAALLVRHAYPESRERLIALSSARRSLASAGVRIVALPIHARASVASRMEGVDPNILAGSDQSVAAVYSLFLPQRSESRVELSERHAEILLDRAGYVRAVRVGAGAASDVAELLQDAQRLGREPALSQRAPTHMH